MLIVNTIRTGIELLSDIGIGQNIVSNKNSESPIFYNTAWSIKVIRGFLLALICLIISPALATIYDNNILALVLPATAGFFILAGFESTAGGILQKRMDLKRLAVLEVTVAVLSAAIHIALAAALQNVWALLLAGLLSSLCLTIGTYFLIPGIKHRFILDKTYTWEIIHFGKWIFAASLLFFAAMNFDRLYFAKHIPLAVLGVYGIARSFSDMANALVTRFGNMIIFPAIAASDQKGAALRARISRKRALTVVVGATALAVAIALSDTFIRVLYDERYRAAGAMLPVLFVGVWFSILCTINEAVLLGIGRPVYGAWGNAAKLVWLLAAVPLALGFVGLEGALIAVASSEIARYIPLWRAQKREHVSFARVDVAATCLLIFLTAAITGLLSAAGLTSGFSNLLAVPVAVARTAAIIW
jgi:O-antigen/teichoic acid export membrane protein